MRVIINLTLDVSNERVSLVIRKQRADSPLSADDNEMRASQDFPQPLSDVRVIEICSGIYKRVAGQVSGWIKTHTSTEKKRRRVKK